MDEDEAVVAMFSLAAAVFLNLGSGDVTKTLEDAETLETWFEEKLAP